jgi:hypothetical protein
MGALLVGKNGGHVGPRTPLWGTMNGTSFGARNRTRFGGQKWFPILVSSCKSNREPKWGPIFGTQIWSHFWFPKMESKLIPKLPNWEVILTPMLDMFWFPKVDLRNLRWMPQETTADREKWISCFQKTMNSGCRGRETISSSGLERVPNPISKTQLPCTGSSLLGKNNG